ncbi:MAG: winged helix-turn-helix transcriptional regulator [Chloroflexi bacterium]|nr:winged helix-turn-helix transcriptional regulator [Chloroflexota bacterium]
MNSEPATEVKQHEYTLLNEIAQDSMVTQANLSNRLGIAVGSVNWYIKRLISRGWIKVSHLDRTRLKYDLTPEGLKVITQRAMSYARDSLKVYGSLRMKAKKLVEDLKAQGILTVYIHGDDETMDILRLTCIEAGLKINDLAEGCVLESTGQDFQALMDPQIKKK